MNRQRKKEISLNKDSVLGLMQEIYNELVEQRATAIRIQNKMLALLKDAEDMTVIGPIIKEQQKIATCLSSLDSLITAESEKIEQLKWHKKGLMQGLFPKIND